jgi:hypothetical protein
MAGLAFFESAVLEIAIKSKPESQWWVVMIALAIGLTFMLVGFVYGRRAGDREKNEADARELAKDKAKEDAAKAKEDAERHRHHLERIAQSEREEREREERRRAKESQRVIADENELAAINSKPWNEQSSAYSIFVSSHRECGNCENLQLRSKFCKPTLINQHNWLMYVCSDCSFKLWHTGCERMWFDDYKSQLGRK